MAMRRRPLYRYRYLTRASDIDFYPDHAVYFIADLTIERGAEGKSDRGLTGVDIDRKKKRRRSIMRQVGCMRIAHRAGVLVILALLSVGCGQQKGAGAPRGEGTAAVQEQSGAEAETADETVPPDQSSQQAVPAAPADQEQAGTAKADKSVSSGDPAGSDGSAKEGSGALTAKEAEEKALAHVGLTPEQVTYIQSKADYEKGRQVYEVEFYTQDGKEYDYEIDADTGEVIGYDYDAEGYAPSAALDGSGLTAEEVKALALANVPGAADADIREFEMDRDDGRIEYEGKIVYDGMEYEFEIDGLSGMIRSWEAEPVGR